MKSGIIKKIPVLYLVAAGILIAAIAGYMLLVRPAKEHASATATEVQNTQLQIATVERQLAGEQSRQNLIEVADLVELAKAMPNDDGPAAAMLQLVGTADAAGVTLTAVQPGSPILADGYTRFPMTISLVGNYYDLTEFLYQVRSLVTVRQGVLDATGPLFTVDNVNWHESDEADESPSRTSRRTSSSRPTSTGWQPTRFSQRRPLRAPRRRLRRPRRPKGPPPVRRPPRRTAPRRRPPRPSPARPFR